MAANVAINLKNAFGAMVVANNSSSSLALVEQHNNTIDRLKLPAKKLTVAPSTSKAGLQDTPRFSLAGTPFHFPNLADSATATSTDTSSGSSADFLKIQIDGTTTNALETESAAAYAARAAAESTGTIVYGNSTPQTLPSILAVVESTGTDSQVYVQFQNPFQFRNSPPGVNAWDATSGYQCQLFRLTGGSAADLKTNAPALNNLECIDNKHFVQGWQQGQNVFQFDSAGNVYYPGGLPNTNQVVVNKIGPSDTWESTPTEIINANICVQNFLVTPSGGVFYTGSTCAGGPTGGSMGGNSGYFRYIDPADGSVTQIANNWWNFVYDTRVQTNTESTVDTAVFFGPDPTNATAASWNTACLFEFDPTGDSPQTRISQTITCGNDIWSWIAMSRAEDITTYGHGLSYQTQNLSTNDIALLPSWKAEYQKRCETSSQIFAGGSQISRIEQTRTGDIYVIGQIQQKVEGTLSCNVSIRGPFCLNSGVPVLSGFDTSNHAVTVTNATTCGTVGGTWTDSGNCSWGNTNNIAACLGTTNSWNSGESICTDAAGNKLTQFTNQPDCLNTNTNHRVWNLGENSYQNITNEYCTATETGDRSVFQNWQDPSNSYTTVTNSTTSTLYNASTYAGKFIVNNFNCSPVTSGSNSSGGGNSWSEQLQALGKVDPTNKTLLLLSKRTEQALNLWVVNDTPFYSSFDTSLGEYLLSKMDTSSPACVDTSITLASTCTATGATWDVLHRNCVMGAYTTANTCTAASKNYAWVTESPMQVLKGFETYAFSKAPDVAAGDNSMLVNGLNFSTNQYEFGSVNLNATTPSVTLNPGVTGIVQTLMLLH